MHKTSGTMMVTIGFPLPIAAAWTRFKRMVTELATLLSQRVDLALTFFFILFWLWFAWQHGYANSPDSWYRGLLAKSIIQGHPYLINLRQGWLYDYPTWHHDAAHPPFLPAIYAAYFFFFGPKISISNVVVSLSAGVLVWPVLRLSRLLTGGPIAGLVVYLAVAFNDQADFLFEVFYGLSIPVALALLVAAFYFVVRLADNGTWWDLAGGMLALVSFYYVRPGEQLIFCWFMLWALVLGQQLLPRERWLKQMQMWGGASLLALPWAVRNLVLFSSPFFTHTTPSLWTDRGYDYWDYHETIPLPSAAAYFATHSMRDFAKKIVTGTANYLGLLNEALGGELLLLALGVVYAMVVVLLRVKEARTRYAFLLLFLCLIGYCVMYSLVPVLDKRYMMLPQFVVLMIIAGAAFLPSSDASLRFRLPLIALLAIYVPTAQAVFWSQRFGTYLKFSYTTSDQQLAKDRTIEALKQRLSPDDIVLGPLAAVQRLSFATGLSFIEVPENLTQLRNPPAFFRRFRIRYSLVDVSRILPEEMIEKMEVVGNLPLFQIRLDEPAAEHPGNSTPPSVRKPTPTPARFPGVRERRVYVDIYHGSPIPNEHWLGSLGNMITIGAGDFLVNRARILRSGLIIIRYAMHKPEIDEREFAILEEFMRQGGRILLLCPAWVPVSYEGKSLQDLNYNRIAQRFGMLITANATSPPFSLDAGFNESGGMLAPGDKPAFSRIIGVRSALPILADQQGNPVAMAARAENSRLVVWGHDNMLNNNMLETTEGRRLVKRIFAWLWSER